MFGYSTFFLGYKGAKVTEVRTRLPPCTLQKLKYNISSASHRPSTAFRVGFWAAEWILACSRRNGKALIKMTRADERVLATVLRSTGM